MWKEMKSFGVVIARWVTLWIWHNPSVKTSWTPPVSARGRDMSRDMSDMSTVSTVSGMVPSTLWQSQGDEKDEAKRTWQAETSSLWQAECKSWQKQPGKEEMGRNESGCLHSSLGFKLARTHDTYGYSAASDAVIFVGASQITDTSRQSMKFLQTADTGINNSPKVIQASKTYFWNFLISKIVLALPLAFTDCTQTVADSWAEANVSSKHSAAVYQAVAKWRRRGVVMTQEGLKLKLRILVDQNLRPLPCA